MEKCLLLAEAAVRASMITPILCCQRKCGTPLQGSLRSCPVLLFIVAITRQQCFFLMAACCQPAEMLAEQMLSFTLLLTYLAARAPPSPLRSEEHTSELQSHS